MFALRNIRRASSFAIKYNNILGNYNHNHTFPHVATKFKFNKIFKPYCTKYQISNETVKISEAFLNLGNNYKEQLRIAKQDIEQLIFCIENEEIIKDDNYLLLLHCCGNLIPDESSSTRIYLAQQVWKTLINKNIKLTTDHYNALLHCYIENKMIISHKEFLNQMICEPNEQTYGLLLQCVCESGDLDQAIDIVNLMKEKGFAVNEPVFSSLILCHLKKSDIKSAQNILSTMRIAQINPSSNTYTALLRGYAENNELTLFKNTLSSAQSREFNLNELISILQSVSLSENLELLPLIKRTWTLKFDSRIFNTKLNNLCINLIYLKKPKIAYELFKNLSEPEIGFVSESDTYGSFLIYELIKSKTAAEIIINIADDLIKTNRNIYALYKATELAFKTPDINLSLILLQALYNRKIMLRNHYFWPVLIHDGRKYGEKGIMDIFAKMHELNIKIEPETLEFYSLQYIKNIDPEMVINKLKQFDLTVTDVLSPISVVLLREGKMNQVSNLTSRYKVKLDGNRLIKQLSAAYIAGNDLQNTINILKNIQIKNNQDDWAGILIFYIFTRSGTNINYEQILKLLQPFVNIKNMKRIMNIDEAKVVNKQFLQAYKKNNIKLSASYVDKIEHLSKKIKSKQIKNKILQTLHNLEVTYNLDNNNHIRHPRNMNLEEMECHLIELRNKQMETRGILRKLIQMHSRNKNSTRVSELMTEFKSSGYILSPGMKSSILDLFIKTEQLEKAWNIYQDLKQNHGTFSIDNFKIIDLSGLLCSNNRFQDAYNILETINNISVNQIEHNCWALLDTVAKMGKTSELKTIFKILIKNNYCKESNIILGPLIRVHICNNDKKGATDEYVNCCTKYNKTPLLHELLCYLVQKESSSELIEQVLESSAQIHGTNQTQTTLAAALAETGLTKTLRKLFLDSNLFLSQTLLEQYCERWIKENKINALKNIIKCGQGITGIDLNVVYFYLMRMYSSNNDNNNVLKLWNEIQEQNIFPSTKIKNLVDNLVTQ